LLTDDEIKVGDGKSGVYWFEPEKEEDGARKSFIDMEFDDGGWVLAGYVVACPSPFIKGHMSI
jgi:hypothetical protein